MKSIQKKFVMNFLLMSIIPICILGIINYYIYVSGYKDRIQDEMINTVQQVGKNVENKLNNIDKYMYMIFTDERIQEIVEQYDFNKDYNNLLSRIETLGKTFAHYFEDETYLQSAVLFDINGGEYIYRNKISRDPADLRDSQWFPQVMESNGQVFWIGPEKLKDRYNNEHDTFSVARLLKDVKNIKPLSSIGMVHLSFSEDMFGDIYKEMQREDADVVMVINSNGKFVSHVDKSLIGTNISKAYYNEIKAKTNLSGCFQTDLDNRSVFVSYYKIPEYDWLVIKIVGHEYMVRQNIIAFSTVVVICLVCFVCTFFLSIFISERIAKPLLEINNAMGKVEEGEFSIRLSPTSNDEVGKIQARFNVMTQRLSELFQNTIKIEYQKNREQLRALQYQVNPHFLYNTLNSVRLMAILANNNHIRLMLEALIRLLKNTIGKIGEMISVMEEINSIKDYIYIQQVKNDGKIQVSYHIDQEINDFLVPNFILQPIIENAIFHGLEPKKDSAGSLKIFGKNVNNTVVFTIQDDGIGMTEEQIKRIFEENTSSKTFVRIGIKNVHDRIRLSFGETYGVTVSSSVGGGTMVIIRLPVILRQEDERKNEDDCC